MKKRFDRPPSINRARDISFFVSVTLLLVASFWAINPQISKLSDQVRSSLTAKNSAGSVNPASQKVMAELQKQTKFKVTGDSKTNQIPVLVIIKQEGSQDEALLASNVESNLRAEDKNYEQIKKAKISIHDKVEPATQVLNTTNPATKELKNNEALELELNTLDGTCDKNSYEIYAES